jgi:hypothetical protein
MSKYEYVEKNIYKRGRSYRIRVGDRNEYASTIKGARRIRTYLKIANKQGKIF